MSPPSALRTGMLILRVGQGSYGNTDFEGQVMGKNRKRVRFCFSQRLRLPRQPRGGPQFIASERITPRGGPRLPNPLPLRRAPRRLSGKIRLQSRLLRSEISFLLDHCVPSCPAESAISASSRLLPSRLLRSGISSRGGAADRGGVRELLPRCVQSRSENLRTFVSPRAPC